MASTAHNTQSDPSAILASLLVDPQQFIDECKAERHQLLLTLTGQSLTSKTQVTQNTLVSNPAHPTTIRLLDLGFLTQGRPLFGACFEYHATAAGAAAVGLHLPPEPAQ